MSRDDWYRNKTWDGDIEAAFTAKLKRARDKSQYLRIQANILADTQPEITLQLLEQYFALGEHFDYAQAWVDKARAHLSLGQVALAIQAYQATLAREASCAKYQTRAYLELPYLVATHGLKEHYQECITLLENTTSRLMFPVDRFVWAASYAILLQEKGKISDAKEYAKAALEAAAQEKSGFRYHPTVGLVGNKYEQTQKRLVGLTNA
jgi:tetratricopeptide (TPR) repeat protein